MKHRIFNYLLVASLFVIAAGSFVSCKDDDDNAQFTESIAKNANLIEGLQSQLKQLEAAQALCKQECAAQAESLVNARIAVVTDLLNKQNVRIDSVVKVIADNNKAALELYGQLEKQVGANTESLQKLNAIVLGYEDAFADLYRKAAADSVTASQALALATSADSLATLSLSKATALEVTVDELGQAYKTADQQLQDQIDNLSSRVTAIENALKQMVTSIAVNGTYSPVLGYYALPTGDVRSTVVAAYYGDAEAFRFPTATAGFYADERYKLTFEDLEVTGNTNAPAEGGKLIVTEDGQQGNAGNIYLTLNPINVDLTGKKFTLVNSQGTESLVSLSEAQASDKELSFGWNRYATRATQSANGFYEVKATVTAENARAVKPNVNVNDLRAAASELMSTWQYGRTDLLKIFSLLYNNFDNTLPALALKTTWTNEAGTQATLSQYSVAATAVKPLSFGTAKDMNVKLPTITALQQVGVNIDTVYVTPTAGLTPYTLTIVYNDGKVSTYTIEEVDRFVDNLNKQYTNLANKAIGKVNNFIGEFNQLSDRMSGIINRFNQRLQPVLVIQKDNEFFYLGFVPYGADALESGANIILTSYTAELLAPAYKKWVAVTNVWNNTEDAVKASKGETVASAQSGDATLKAALDNANKGTNMNKVVYGTTTEAQLGTLESGKLYEIAYSAVDYSGKVAARKFYVRGK
jgi:hypothetical protein